MKPATHRGAPAAVAGPQVTPEHAARLAGALRVRASELGFSALGITTLELGDSGERFRAWLERGHHGDMDYLERNIEVREHPTRLVRTALRMVSVRMDYLPADADEDWLAREQARFGATGQGVVALYARGRDYHRSVRGRLARLADVLLEAVPGCRARALCDSGPVFEVEFARRAGTGWRGKHTLLLTREAGSLFFLGEILTDLPLPVDAPVTDHCGSCTRCISACPTGAILGPFELDARRCISYLTIEHEGAIAEDLRPLMGNRIYGCDDCQLACPWNRYARAARVPDFTPRADLDAPRLADLLAWTRQEFLDRLTGSAIRRIGYARWSRNLAVALGNAPPSEPARSALQERLRIETDEMVREHLQWALHRQSRGSV